MSSKFAKKGEKSDWQKRFSAAFSGKKLAIKKQKGQDQSKKARDERRRRREANR